MVYTAEQQLFLDMIGEAKALLKDIDVNFKVTYDDYPCAYIDGHSHKSMNYYCPITPIYEDNELLVEKNWVHDSVENFLPTIMRSFAYYYTYCFYSYKQNNKKPLPYPQDKNAISFACGLCALYGVPVSERLVILGEKRICDTLSKFTGHNYQFVDCVSAKSVKSKLLSFNSDENLRLSKRMKYIAEQTKEQKLNVIFGTKDNPFNNINEAIEYIKFLETEAVKSDPYLNSELIVSPYRYDCGFLGDEKSKTFMGLFKIPWASAESALVNNGFPDKSFVVTQINPNNGLLKWINEGDAIPFIPTFSLKPNLHRRRFLYRGQTEEYHKYGTDLPTCVPNAYREDVENNTLPSRIKSCEIISLITQHPLVQLLGIHGVTIFNEPFLFQLNLRGLAQHYYNKTSLLDLTSEIDVAKFFATSIYIKETDSYLPFSSDDKLGIIYVYDIRYLNDFKKLDFPHLSTIGKQYVFPRSAMQAGFLLDMPKGVNLHDCPNVYKIYFRHNKAISEKVAEETNYGERYFPADCLKHMWGVKSLADNNEFFISKKARELYMILYPNDFKTIEELNEAIKQNDFNLGENVWPEIPKDVLEEYYSHSEDIWNSFCEDIYFAGTEGQLMKKAMRDLYYNPKYRKYFHRLE